MKLLEYPDRDMMMIDLANVLAGEIGAALRSKDAVSIAVPGGTTPGPVFDALCAADLDWSRVTVIPTDERWVPEDHDRSNARLIRSRLLTARAAGARFLSLYTGDDTPEAAEPALADALAPQLPLSVLLLGMGDDMHTASLIPGADRLAEALDPGAPPLMILHAPSVPEPRITMTAQVLEKALFTHIVITGESKRAALERAARLDATEAPIRQVLSGATVHWAK